MQGRSMDGVPASHTPVLQEMLDLRPYIDSSAAAVQESFSVERTYVVFRTLGLRHLVVTDRHNHVKGVVTRKVTVSSSAHVSSEWQHVQQKYIRAKPAIAWLPECEVPVA